MGGSQSKTVINSLSQTISNIAMQTVMSCEVASDQSQDLVVTNSGFKLWGSYKLEQQTDIKSECFSDVTKQADLQNKIIQAISQTSTADNVALLGAFSSSNASAIANLTNIVKNNVTMSNIQKSYIQIRQKQTATIGNKGVVVFEQVELTQGSKIFAAATLQEIDKAGIFNQISSHVDQAAAAKQENPLDFIAKAVGAIGSSVTSTMMFFVFMFVVVIIGAGYAIKLMGGPTAVAGAVGKIPLPQTRAVGLAARAASVVK